MDGVNKGLIAVVGIAMFGILMLSLTYCSRNPEPKPINHQQGSAASVEGDTPAEVLRNVMSKMNELERGNKQREEDFAKLKNDLAQAANKPGAAAPQTQSGGIPLPQQAQIEELKAKNAQLEHQLEEARARSANDGGAAAGAGKLGGDIPPGFGYAKPGGSTGFSLPQSGVLSNITSHFDLLPGSTSGNSAPRAENAATAASGIVWVKALDAHETGRSTVTTGLSLPGAPAPNALTAPDTAHHAAGTAGAGPRKTADQPKPVYTIPANATLLGAVAMTALVGRIPQGGSVQDPYPFKVITGSENLATNGIHIPGLKGMVWQGTAVGDWGLSCVRGTLDQVTYTFEDGTIQTVDLQSAKRESGTTGSSGATTPATRALAWISDERGICIAGQRITNAAPVLLEKFGASTLQSAMQAYQQAQTTQTFSGATGVGTSLLTGNIYKYGAGAGLAGGASDLQKWLNDRLGEIFDAIYAPPGQPISIHVNVEIPINYDPIGRKVNQEESLAHVSLD